MRSRLPKARRKRVAIVPSKTSYQLVMEKMPTADGTHQEHNYFVTTHITSNIQGNKQAEFDVMMLMMMMAWLSHLSFSLLIWRIRLVGSVPKSIEFLPT